MSRPARRGRIVFGLVVASWALLFGLYSIPATPAGSTSERGIGVQPKLVLIAGVPTEVFVGSYTGSRAVLQFETDERNATSLFRDLSRGLLISNGDEVAGVPAVGRTSGSRQTLTMTFYRTKPIGAAQYSVTVKGVQYSFACNWLNA